MLTILLKRDIVRVACLATVVDSVTNFVVVSSDFFVLPGRTAVCTWNKTLAPTSAGETVPYRRTNPWRPAERTLKVTRGATCSVTTGLNTGSASRVTTRTCGACRPAGSGGA